MNPMKKIIYSFAVFTLAFFISFSAEAKIDSDYVKSYSQQYNVNPNVHLKTETSFGKVTLESWDNNEVQIDVEVTVDAKNENEAEKVFDKIELIMHGSKERVSLETKISGNHNNNEFEINIRIKAPENTILDLTHGFGNLKIGTFRNKAEINASYGELEIENLSNADLEINMSFGEASIDDIGGGKLDVEFGAMEINHLHHSSKINCSYSSFEVKVEGVKCTDLEIDNEFGSVDVEIPENMAYRVEGKASFGDIELPKNIRNENIEKDFASYSVEAIIGQNPEGELVIDSSFGNVTVEFR